MYTSHVDDSGAFDNRSALPPPFLFEKPYRFSLDASGVVGLLGGDDAVSAIAAVHVYGNHCWLGWYNNPGSLHIAKRFRSFAKSAPSFGGILGNAFSSSSSSSKPLSKNVDADPAALLELESWSGPKFRAAQSGTVIEGTGYLAALFMKECAAWNSGGIVIPGRKTRPIEVTIAELGQAPPSEMRPAHSGFSTVLFACVPIAASVGACVLCAVCGDWYASLLILAGIVANGISCLVLGSAELVFSHPEPAKGSPAGDGILGSDKDIVLLKGTEGAVNSITRGKFSLRFSSEGRYGLVQRCSFLFFAQCIAQLLLIPQASLFGQIMFLASLGVSAVYNACLSSPDKERVHQKLLLEGVLEHPPLTKFTLGTRTTAVVFILLALRSRDPGRLLDELLPNDTKVWKEWKAAILELLRHPDDQSLSFNRKVDDLEGFTQQEKDLLGLLYEDARAAYNGYREYL